MLHKFSFFPAGRDRAHPAASSAPGVSQTIPVHHCPVSGVRIDGAAAVECDVEDFKGKCGLDGL